MKNDSSRKADEAAVKTVIDAIANAVRKKDVEALLSHCAPNIAAFDRVEPLKHQGNTAIRALWTRTLGDLKAPLDYDIQQLDVVAGGDAAFSRSLNRLGGIGPDGKRTEQWVCSTMGFRKIDGKWKVVHEHRSVPYDPETGQALLDLKP